MMTCREASASDLAARYVSGQLGPEERDSYEQHYFQCAHCFDDVQLHMSMQAALKNAPKFEPARIHRPWVAWGAIAATVVIMATIGFYRLRLQPRAAAPPATAAAPAAADPFEALARVEPPPYQPPVLRGADPQREPHFRLGMESYRAANYAAAIDQLSQADPKSPDVQLFLGISYLMRDQPDAALSHLRATLQLGDSLDIEPAHFYLAKAFLKRHDAASAKAELDAVIALHGDYEKQAHEILSKIP